MQNIDIGIDIDKGILQNIDNDEISYRLEIGYKKVTGSLCVQAHQAWKGILVKFEGGGGCLDGPIMF